MSFFSRREALAGAALAFPFRNLLALPLSEIKLGVTTDEIDDDVATAAKFLQDSGLGWAEVRNIWGKYNTAQPMDKIHEARAILDQHKIQVSIEGTGFFKVPLPAENAEGQKALDEQWSLLDAAMERGKAFGTNKIRVFGFTFRPGQTATEKDYSRIYELVTEASRRALTHGFRLALENVNGSFIETGAQSAELLKHVKEGNLGLTWDPNNAGAGGEKSFPDGYGKLDVSRIFHVHLRDYKKGASGKIEWCAVGDGEFDNLGQIRALLKSGYKQTFTLETHWKSPKGKLHATDTSLKALLKVVKEV